MGFDHRYLKKLEENGAISVGVRLPMPTTTKPEQDLSTDLKLLICAVENAGYPRPELEYAFHPVRKWRFDLAWIAPKIAVERHGGKFVSTSCECGKRFTRFVSKHHDRNGLEMDAEKSNAATSMGWSVIVATPMMLQDGRALQAVLETLKIKTTRSSGHE